MGALKQECRILHPPDRYVGRMAMSDVFQRGADRQDAHAPPHRQRFGAAQGGEGEVQGGIGIHQLLCQ